MQIFMKKIYFIAFMTLCTEKGVLNSKMTIAILTFILYAPFVHRPFILRSSQNIKMSQFW